MGERTSDTRTIRENKKKIILSTLLSYFSTSRRTFFLIFIHHSCNFFFLLHPSLCIQRRQWVKQMNRSQHLRMAVRFSFLFFFNVTLSAEGCWRMVREREKEFPKFPQRVFFARSFIASEVSSGFNLCILWRQLTFDEFCGVNAGLLFIFDAWILFCAL